MFILEDRKKPDILASSETDSEETAITCPIP